MLDNKNGLYAAFKAKDARFDGRFFVGISSTGIYCRPVCRAKQPKPENCTFYATASEAEQAGYRPCLLCRPELAPGQSATDASANLAHVAMRLIEENCGSEQSLEELASKLNCTSRHLRRVFAAEFNVSPVQYLQTCRLLLAKNLLTDTNLSVLDVAMSSGFGSLRRFNDLFKKHYKLAPTALRKQILKGEKQHGEITLALGYRPPYSWDEILKFLGGRAISGIEKVEGGNYLRTVRMVAANGEIVHGWIKVGHNPKKNALNVTVGESLLSALPQVLMRVKQVFDLHCDPHTVYECLSSINDVRPGLYALGTRLPGCFNGFEMAVRAILGQQISVKAARTLAGRMVNEYGKPFQTGIEGLTHIFPAPEDIVTPGDIENQSRELGITSAKARAILSVADALLHQKIDLEFCLDPEQEIQKLMAIRGIGSWTARYIAMRILKCPDAFLETDIGVKKVLGGDTPEELIEMAEKWRPWRSYATVAIWNIL